MKSNKALIKGVSQETYCRHGFHDWMRATNKVSLDLPEKPQCETELKCKHCGRQKRTS